MSDSTRFVRLPHDVDRDLARNEPTHCPREFWPNRVVHDERSLFNDQQRRMAQILREHIRPGVAVFALHPERGLAGQLWLEATQHLRAASIGRHGRVDLYLASEEALSLRHFLVLVRRVEAGTRIQVLDLVTPHGFQAEGHDVLRALESRGPVVFSAAGYTFIAVPTGAGTPWDANAWDAWSTLSGRDVETTRRAVHRLRRATSTGGAAGGTFVSIGEGPIVAEPDQLLQPGESVAGQLRFLDGRKRRRLSVGATALRRGVVVGRYERCAGRNVVRTMEVSRVHAVLLEADGVVHLVDAGSTNGVTLDGRTVSCEPVLPGRRYQLGPLGLRWEPS